MDGAKFRHVTSSFNSTTNLSPHFKQERNKHLSLSLYTPAPQVGSFFIAYQRYTQDTPNETSSYRYHIANAEVLTEETIQNRMLSTLSAT